MVDKIAMKIKIARALLKDGEDLLEELRGVIRTMGSPDSDAIDVRTSTWGTRLGQFLEEKFGRDSQYYKSEFVGYVGIIVDRTDAEELEKIEADMVRKVELLKAVIKDLELEL